jgi:transposase
MAWVKRSYDRERRFLDAIRAGNTRGAAASLAGIDRRTFERWCNRDVAFAASVTRAEGESEAALVAIIRAQAPVDWRAAFALLERRFPDTWGRRDRIDIELYVRNRARELGLDPDEALEETERVLGESRPMRALP